MKFFLWMTKIIMKILIKEDCDDERREEKMFPIQWISACEESWAFCNKRSQLQPKKINFSSSVEYRQVSMKYKYVWFHVDKKFDVRIKHSHRYMFINISEYDV